MWSAGQVDGCLVRSDDGVHQPVELSLSSLEQYGHLRGVVRTSGGEPIVCGVVTVRENEGDDWLDFYLPLGALVRRDARVGAFPFGDDGGAVSRAWRATLSMWLSDIGMATFEQVRFRYAAIGYEASGMSLPELDAEERYFDVLRATVGGGVERLPVTRWDFGRPA